MYYLRIYPEFRPTVVCITCSSNCKFSTQLPIAYAHPKNLSLCFHYTNRPFPSAFSLANPQRFDVHPPQINSHRLFAWHGRIGGSDLGPLLTIAALPMRSFLWKVRNERKGNDYRARFHHRRCSMTVVDKPSLQRHSFLLPFVEGKDHVMRSEPFHDPLLHFQTVTLRQAALIEIVLRIAWVISTVIV